MNSRKPMIAGNWKMYKTCPEAVDTANALKQLVKDAVNTVDIMIAPNDLAIVAVADALKDSGIFLGSQNLFWEKEGAYTGETSAPMLKAAGCSHVIIGHSERRQYFGETDQSVNKKIRAAIDAVLIPVFCIGETEAEREAKKTFSVLDKQIQNGLKGFFSEELKSLIIAYEPVWAIGTGKTASSEQAQQAHQFIRETIEKSLGRELAERMRILYGGSVKPGNVKELMAMPDLDGALVGGASLKADVFSEIVHFA